MLSPSRVPPWTRSVQSVPPGTVHFDGRGAQGGLGGRGGGTRFSARPPPISSRRPSRVPHRLTDRHARAGGTDRRPGPPPRSAATPQGIGRAEVRGRRRPHGAAAVRALAVCIAAAGFAERDGRGAGGCVVLGWPVVARDWRRLHRGAEGARRGPWRSAVLRRRSVGGDNLVTNRAPKTAIMRVYCQMGADCGADEKREK